VIEKGDLDEKTGLIKRRKNNLFLFCLLFEKWRKNKKKKKNKKTKKIKKSKSKFYL